jgi:hypothetical protein
MVRRANRRRGATLTLGLSALLGLPACGEWSGDDGVADVGEALISGAPYPTPDVALVLVDFGSGVNITSQQAAGVLNTNASSLRNFFLYDSYGRQDIAGQVVGPVPYVMNSCSNSDLSRLATDLRSAAGDRDHYIWYFGSKKTACQWTSLGSVGTPSSHNRDSWVNASTTCLALAQGIHHNFGELHAAGLHCPGGPFHHQPDQCTSSPYGDRFDAMGGACRHLTAWRKAHQGWLGGCNGVNVTASGTFTLLPYERRCDGPQFLKIQAPVTRVFNRPADASGASTTELLDSYYLELRTPLDFDGTLGGPALAPSVLIHVGGPLGVSHQPGRRTFLLDMTPGTSSFNDAALVQGQSFTDPAGGLTITAQAVSATQATIVVTSNGSGAPTCLDGSTFTPPGPSPATSCVDNPPTPVP